MRSGFSTQNVARRVERRQTIPIAGLALYQLKVGISRELLLKALDARTGVRRACRAFNLRYLAALWVCLVQEGRRLGANLHLVRADVGACS